MSVLCGWASIDERGKVRGGKAGDQTGKEVKTGSWYNFGQTVCLRWKNTSLGRKYAEIIKALCANRHIGYDQNQRTTLFNELKRLGWDYTKLSNDVECDCSELIACGINCTLKSTIIPSYVYTGNLNSVLLSTGYFKKFTGTKYCKSSEYLMIGDVLNRPGHHVISVLQNGIKAGVKNDTSTVAEPPLYRGCTGSEVKKLQGNLNKLGYPLKCDGIFGADTKEAVRKFQNDHGLVVDGYYGEKTYAAIKKSR